MTTLRASLTTTRLMSSSKVIMKMKVLKNGPMGSMVTKMKFQLTSKTQLQLPKRSTKEAVCSSMVAAMASRMARSLETTIFTVKRIRNLSQLRQSLAS